MGGRVPASNEKHVSDDLSPRAAKRRRVAEIPLDPAVSAAVGPLFNDPSQGHSRALRVQVLRIGHASQPDPEANGLFRGNGSPVKKDVPFKEIRARCKLTISKFIPKVERRPMYCDSQTCEVKLYRDADGVCRHARIYLQSPFQIPADKLYIERDDTQGFMLADSYLVQTELESAGDGKWPPFELFRGQEQQETEGTPPRQWVLSSIFTYTISKGRLTTAVKLRKSANNEPMTDLMMDTDLRWSTPANMHEPEHQLLRAAEPRPNGVLAPLTNATANGRVEKVFRDIREEDRDMEDEEEGDAEALTPSRSLRMRDKPQNYNLKALSDRARGKELKERKKKKDARGGDAGHVTWILPITRDLETEKWSCIRCNKEHDSIASLKAHLEKHEEYRFTAEYTEQYGWRIVVAQSIPDTPQTSRKTESLEPLSPNHHEHEAQHQSPTRAAKQEQSKPAIVVSHS